jgi:hypothetical protein
MAETLSAAPRRTMSPVAGFVIALAIVAAIALGFALRTWTEDTSRPAPLTVLHPAQSVGGHSAPQPICRVGQPC